MMTYLTRQFWIGHTTMVICDVSILIPDEGSSYPTLLASAGERVKGLQ